MSSLVLVAREGHVSETPACYHCEPDPARRHWLRPDAYCERCRRLLDPDYEEPRPTYTPDEIRHALRSLVGWTERGIERESHVIGQVKVMDIWTAHKAMHDHGRFTPLEDNVVALRLIHGLSNQRTVAQINLARAQDAIARGLDPASLQPVQAYHVSKATKSASRKLAVWLNSGSVTKR